MVVEIRNLQKTVKINRKEIKNKAKKILKFLDVEKAHLNIVFVTDYKIRVLNKKYRKKDRPTDVLAFNMAQEPFGAGGKMLGELVISADTAMRNSRRFKTNLRRETILYVLHGILHLAGYDDETKRGLRRMGQKQEELLARI